MFPEDSIQAQFGSWWVEDPAQTVVRGRLIRTLVPYPEQKPHRLFVAKRSADPGEHSRAELRVEPFRPGTSGAGDGLPVAALPLHPGEHYAVQRSKVRPAIVVSSGGRPVPAALRRDAAAYQSARTLLVAPYYGADASYTRGGWGAEFVKRIRHGEYPQYMTDALPIGGVAESILRLDHLFPIGADPAGYQISPWRLSEDALQVVDEWVSWLFAGGLQSNTSIAVFQELFRDL